MGEKLYYNQLEEDMKIKAEHPVSNVVLVMKLLEKKPVTNNWEVSIERVIENEMGEPFTEGLETIKLANWSLEKYP